MTRQGILTVAAEAFVARGYAGTSLREIGRLAGVDAALVIHYFGSKEKLFLEAVALAQPDQPLLEGPTSTLGERFIRFLLTADEQVRAIYLVLIRGSDTDAVAARVRHRHEVDFVEPLRARLTGPDAELRARLAAALVGGLLYALWVVGDEVLLATDHEVLVVRYGRLLQELIDPVA
jgi:AcrR family transcriptional regulator